MVKRFLLFLILSNSSLLADPIIVSLPDTISLPATTMKIPIKVSDVTDNEIYSFGAAIVFNSHILDFITLSTENTLASNWTEVAINDSSGRIKLSLAGISALAGHGTLLYLTFDVIGNLGDMTVLDFTFFEFNDGTPETLIKDGRLTVTDKPVIVFIPDTVVTSGSIIHIPIMMSNITGLDIFSVGMIFSYNSSVFRIVDVKTENTLSETWGEVLFNNFSDTVFISLAGGKALNSSGVLIYLSFEIVGNNYDSTTIHFQHFELNDGYPIAETIDGKINFYSMKIHLSLPETTAFEDSSIRIPIEISDVIGLGIYSIEMTVIFNQNVIDASGIDMRGTITENWDKPIFADDAGKIIIGLEGREPLQKKGVLIFIDFEVIGQVNDFTKIIFDRVYVDVEQLTVITHNGIVNVVGSAKVSPLAKSLSDQFILFPNFPNPFNPQTTIRFQIPYHSHVELKIYNVRGEDIRTLIEGFQIPGDNFVLWDGRDDQGEMVSAGVYFVRFKVERMDKMKFTRTQKMTVVR